MTNHAAALGDRVVVVGASLAGLRSAEALRRSGYIGEVVIIGDEPHEPYNRPPLSKQLHETSAASTPLAKHRTVHDVTWRLTSLVQSCDLDAQTVTLATGEVISWGGLITATGLRPRALTLAGPSSGVLRLRTCDDAAALRGALDGASSLIVIGGGFIGCEVAAAAARHGVDVHLVAPEPQPLHGPLGDLVATEVRRRLDQFGVRCHLGAVPLRYTGTDSASGVDLSNRTSLRGDVIVEAVGSIPNTEWLTGNGVDLRDGVVTDEFLRVDGRPNVVACGDVARFPLPAFGGEPARLEHWTVAVETARRAGSNLGAELTGQSENAVAIDLVPSFWSHLDTIRLQAFGRPALGRGDVRVLEGELRGDAAVGYHRDGALVGVVLLGLASRYAHYLHEIGHTARQFATR